MKPVIEVNQVWKEYNKGIDRRYKSLRDTFINLPNNIWGEKKEKFWALQDINFQVEAGESIGIIGRNGAGKSTLLKILSRITPPTKGSITLRGRVASLLEVGTGFHPELTGRENIYFNGSILGMKNAEIKRKFDEIVDFSGVESFIDTPLKHYSSGMQMRLAFSVAAHLDAEIILIDEVLAVGDAEFQKKCIGKMDDVSKGEGKTVVFVSHDMSLINLLCKNSLVLEKSKLLFLGNTLKSTDTFKQILASKVNDINEHQRVGDGRVKVTKIEIKNTSKNQNIIFSGDDILFDFFLQSEQQVEGNLHFAIGIDNDHHQRIAIINSEWKYDGFKYSNKNHKLSITIKNFPLTQGTYYTTTHCTLNGIVVDWVKNCFNFEVQTNDYYNVKRIVPNHRGNFLFEFDASLQ